MYMEKGSHGLDSCAVSLMSHVWSFLFCFFFSSLFKVKHVFINCLVVLFLFLFHVYRMTYHYINKSQSLKLKTHTLSWVFLLHQPAWLFCFHGCCPLGMLCFKNADFNGPMNLTVSLTPVAIPLFGLHILGSQREVLPQFFMVSEPTASPAASCVGLV